MKEMGLSDVIGPWYQIQSPDARMMCVLLGTGDRNMVAAVVDQWCQ